MRITVEFEDRDWDLELDDIDLGEARTIQRNTGKGLADFTRGCLVEADPTCLAWLYWLMYKQNGVKAPDPNRVNFKVARYAGAVMDALEAASLTIPEKETTAEGKAPSPA